MMNCSTKFPKTHLTTALIFTVFGLLIFFHPASAAPHQQFVDCATQTAISSAECDALVALYTSTAGASWTDSSNWLSTTDPCTWYGVTCVGASPADVTEIDLNSNGLTGTLPVVLGDLVSLTLLDLSNNAGLTGSLPAALTGLAALDTFDYSTTGLCEPQESAFQTWISGITTYTPSGNLCDIDCAGGEPTLTVSQAECEELFTLYSSTGGASWTDNSNWLKDYDICTWYGVTCGVGTVTGLDLSGNSLAGSLPATIDNLVNLTAINLSANAGLTGRLPDDLINLSLTTLDFSTTNMCEPLENAFQLWLASITTLNKSGIMCTILCSSGEATVPQVECEGLVALYNSTTGASWTDTTNWMYDYDVCTWFGVSCGSGVVIDLSLPGNNLDGGLPSLIGSFPYMTNLDLSGNLLSGTLPGQLQGLVNLQTLNLADNSFGGTLPNQLGNLSFLNTLDLANNTFSGQVPLTFAYLNVLNYLDTTGSTLCLPNDPYVQAWYAGITTVVDPISNCYVPPSSTPTNTATNTPLPYTLTPTPIPIPTNTPTATMTPTITPTPTELGPFQTLTALANEATLTATAGYKSSTPTASATSYYIMVSQTLVPVVNLTETADAVVSTLIRETTPEPSEDANEGNGFPFIWVIVPLALVLIGTGAVLELRRRGILFAGRDKQDKDGGFETFK
jgi:Leucine-rich repeat (LRR) protein